MRPSISGWFDSTIRIWRPVEVKDTVGVEEREYALHTTVRAAINRSRAPQADSGPGLAATGSVRWYGLASIDVLPRDVCEVIEGPDAGRTWEVDEPPVRPRGHHTQVDCVEWKGTLPTVEPS